jgi:phosphoribosylanthranilate isomerase
MIVKVCGLTRLDDARAAVDAGADYLGVVFHPPSPRFLPTNRAARLIRALRDERPTARFVGVFVDEPVERVAEIVDVCGLDGVQLHGAEPPATVHRLLDRGLMVIKAIRVAEESDLATANPYRPAVVLLDTFVPGQPGGTGRTFNWGWARRLDPKARCLLSGGLTADTVRDAIRVARPWGVDVSSGVETSPGRKDHAALRRFVCEAARTEGESHDDA